MFGRSLRRVPGWAFSGFLVQEQQAETSADSSMRSRINTARRCCMQRLWNCWKQNSRPIQPESSDGVTASRGIRRAGIITAQSSRVNYHKMLSWEIKVIHLLIINADSSAVGISTLVSWSLCAVWRTPKFCGAVSETLWPDDELFFTNKPAIIHRDFHILKIKLISSKSCFRHKKSLWLVFSFSVW